METTRKKHAPNETIMKRTEASTHECPIRHFIRLELCASHRGDKDDRKGLAESKREKDRKKDPTEEGTLTRCNINLVEKDRVNAN